MKKISLVFMLMLSGCASMTSYETDYSKYLEQSTKLIAAQRATEAACLLVVAESLKNPNTQAPMVIANIDRCKSPPIELRPPQRNWLGF